MSVINVNIPEPFKVYVPLSFLEGCDGDIGDRDEYLEGLAIGISALPGQVLGFHVLLRNGALWSRIPLHCVGTKPYAIKRESRAIWPAFYRQRWDCFSEDGSIYVHEALRNAKVNVLPVFSGPAPIRGVYKFTVDFATPAVGDYGWKCLHIIEDSRGILFAMPNTNILWDAPAWVDPEVKIDTSRWQPSSKIYSVG